MFDWFKKPAKKPELDPQLERVEKHLEALGFKMTPFGAGAALTSLMSSYSEADTASGMAVAGFAWLAQETQRATLMLAINAHAKHVVTLLAELREKGLLNPTQFQNDARAIVAVTTFDSDTDEWIEKIVSDPIMGKRPVVTSLVNYSRLLSEL